MGAPERLTGVGPGTVRLARIAAAVFTVGMAVFAVVPVAEALGGFPGSPGRARGVCSSPV